MTKMNIVSFSNLSFDIWKIWIDNIQERYHPDIFEPDFELSKLNISQEKKEILLSFRKAYYLREEDKYQNGG